MRASLLIFGLTLALASPAAAQQRPQREPTEGELQEARSLYVAGQQAVDNGRWSDAVSYFRRAYELSGVGAALFNMAFALRALGRHRETRDAFAQLLRDHPDLEPDLLADARRYRDEAAARVAILSVLGLSPAIRYTIGFDGDRVDDDGDRPVQIEADPGNHSLTVRAPERQPFLWEGSLSEGQRLEVEAVLAELGGRGDDGVERPPEGGISPWLWVAIGLAVAGIGVTVGYFLLRDRNKLDPSADRVFHLP